MSDLRRTQIWLAIGSSTITGSAGTFAAFAFSDHLDVTSPIVAAISGSLVVALIVDWFSQRDDPRHQKPPSDAP